MLFALVLAWPIFGNAQEWKERYVTTTGDTILASDKIAIADRLPIHHIAPRGIQAQSAKVPAKLYLITDMVGGTYEIERLTRIPSDNGYEAFAVIKIVAKDIMPGYAVEYYVDIEKALKAGEVKFLH